MKCDFCKQFANMLYEFEEGKGWYCSAYCFVVATGKKVALKLKPNQR